MIYRKDNGGVGGGLSLVEQKKLQWAKEKEEIAKLNEIFAADTTTITSRKFERASIRTYYSNVDLTSITTGTPQSVAATMMTDHFTSMGTNETYYVQPHTDDERKADQVKKNETHLNRIYERVHSPTLPPIGRAKRNNNKDHQPPQQSPKTLDEDTSGYLSDSGNNLSSSPELWLQQERTSRPRLRLPNESKRFNFAEHHTESRPHFEDPTVTAPLSHRNTADARAQQPMLRNDNYCYQQVRIKADTENPQIVVEADYKIPKRYGTPSSSSSDASREFESSPSTYQDTGASTSYRNKARGEERAKWGDRGVTVGHLFDPAGKFKAGPEWLERGLSADHSGDESVTSYSFIRGQNAPIDANTLAERATKRLRALEFQNAIKEQLAERENKRNRERELRQVEERRQAELQKIQLEADRKQTELEQRKLREKMVNEMKRQEQMRAALEKAAWEAQLEKEKRKHDRGLVSVLDGSSDDYECRLHSRLDTAGSDHGVNDEKPKGPKSPTISCEADPSDSDGEQILIGTPIKLKKKQLGRNPIAKKIPDEASQIIFIDCQQAPNYKFPTSDLSGGLALVLESISPISTLTLFPKDNNVQFSVMLAHKKDNPMPPVQLIEPVGQPEVALKEEKSVDTKTQSVSGKTSPELVGDKKDSQQCAVCGEIPKGLNTAKETNILEELPKEEPVEKKFVLTTLPHGATFTKESNEENQIDGMKSNDVSTQTEDDPSESIVEPAKMVKSVSTNTAPSNIEQPVSDVSVKHDDDDIEKETLTTTTTTMTRTTTVIRSKSKENNHGNSMSRLSAKIEERPKWGVNRPTLQYVKASERDPSSLLRNRWKRYEKRSLSELPISSQQLRCSFSDDKSAAEKPAVKSRSPSPTIRLSRRASHQPQSIVAIPVASERMARTVCTEILPIKTDINGKVFLNFQDASLVRTEDEVKQNTKRKYIKMDQTKLNRRRTSAEIMNELNLKKEAFMAATIQRRRNSATREPAEITIREEHHQQSVDVDLEVC